MPSNLLEANAKLMLFPESAIQSAPTLFYRPFLRFLGFARNDKGPRQWRGPIGLLSPLPELPGPDGLKFGVDLTAVHHVVQGEEVVMPFEVAAFIHPLDKRALAGKEDALSVHGEETIKKRKGREIAPRSLQPQVIRAPGTHQSGILILQISLPWTSNAEEKAGQSLVSPAPGKDPPDLVVIIRIMTIQPFNPFTVRKGAFIDEGWNHTKLAILSPGNESVLFVTHKHNNIRKNFTGYQARREGTIPPEHCSQGLRPACCVWEFGCKYTTKIVIFVLTVAVVGIGR